MVRERARNNFLYIAGDTSSNGIFDNYKSGRGNSKAIYALAAEDTRNIFITELIITSLIITRIRIGGIVENARFFCR